MQSYDRKEDNSPLLPSGSPSRLRSRFGHEKTSRTVIIALLALLCNLCLLTYTLYPVTSRSLDYPTENLESCSWSTLQHHVSLLDVPEIRRIEFLQRQFLLASKLAQTGVEALVMEVSASSVYYANVSTSFGLSERPFLIIIDKRAKFTYLAPDFELSRIADLKMVHMGANVIGWAEDESPYEVLRRATKYGLIMVDEQARFMVAAGLQSAGFNVLPASQAILSLRAVKSRAEITILRGINGFTLQLVRSLQKCIKVGMSQESIRVAASGLFRQAGLDEDWAIVLFGEQAAHPHGGSFGKTLEEGEFVLIDIGSTLHGYCSDVTRTLLPDGSKASQELMDVWELVHASQSIAIDRMHEDELCSVVDEASRRIISDAGYGRFYTHRLGHGLGLEVHEHPYLNGANNETLKIGEVVTNEPVRIPLCVPCSRRG